jgi:chloramphenicol 3-O-phosphotransferase
VSHWDDGQVDSVFVNGTVGVGKTTLAAELSAIEEVPHAVVDLDAIRQLSPPPESDRFNHELELQNLRSLAANFRRAGAQRFIIAGVIEERSEIDRYVDALGSTGMFICRLVASPDVLAGRLSRRHDGDPEGLEWHLARAGNLTNILDGSALDDLVLDSSESSATELARVVRRAAGWV